MLLIGISLTIVVAFIAAVAIFQTEPTSQNKQASAGIPNDNLTIVERANAPTKGPHDAKFTIVEFFNPACETGSIFYPLVNNLIKQYPGKVKVMMRDARLRKGSDQVAKFLEAAHLQGQF